MDQTLDTTNGGEHMLSINDIVTYDRGGIWAQKAYLAPHQPHWNHLANGLSKGPKVNILTEQAQKRKAIPAPNMYLKCRDWALEAKKR